MTTPPCSKGHGPLTRAVHPTTGLFPGWLWLCRTKGCDVTVFKPDRDVPIDMLPQHSFRAQISTPPTR